MTSSWTTRSARPGALRRPARWSPADSSTDTLACIAIALRGRGIIPGRWPVARPLPEILTCSLRPGAGSRYWSARISRAPPHPLPRERPSRIDKIHCWEKAGILTLADKAYQGAEASVVITPYKGRNKPEPQKQTNRSHAKLRGPGECANAQLKSWRIVCHERREEPGMVQTTSC
jgi:hypothetical protein